MSTPLEALHEAIAEGLAHPHPGLRSLAALAQASKGYAIRAFEGDAPGHVGTPPWKSEAVARRNTILARVRATSCRDLAEQHERYRTRTWPTAKRAGRCPHEAGTTDALLWAALKWDDSRLSKKQVHRILSSRPLGHPEVAPGALASGP
ncbi:MAG TPA: hypothetical protein VGG07_10270 [Solirubrobacteraceae bacterium]|jgi:hypothetical protein